MAITGKEWAALKTVEIRATVQGYSSQRSEGWTYPFQVQ